MSKEALNPPAQQEPRIDIYRSFEQWKSGNVLEHGVPRTEFYTKADLDLVEMGWNYGYDAGRAVEQALDKKAENARELGLDYEPAQQEPVVWMYQDKSTHEVRFQKHMRDFVDHGATYETPLYTTPPQRTWVGLTDEEAFQICVDCGCLSEDWLTLLDAIEAKLKEKNT